MDFIQNFIEHMSKHGIELHEAIKADGTINRARINSDKGSKRTLAYKLNVETTEAWGWYCDHSQGETIKYSSYDKNATPLTPEQQAQRIRNSAERKQRHDEEFAKQREKSAEEANRIWILADKEGMTPYLERKNITLVKARIYEGNVVIPMVSDSKIISLQTIYPDGTKEFLYGGQKQGSFFPIYGDESKERIILCEGYATGVSLRLATSLPIVVCFDAGNIIHVARKIRQNFPQAQLIFCADNDQWRKNGNIGIKSAQAALDEVGGQGLIKVPPFEVEHPDRTAKDWNDYINTFGVEAAVTALALTKQEVASFTPQETNTLGFAKKPLWHTLTKFSDKMETKPSKTVNNMIVALTHRDGYSGLYAYNEFSCETIVLKCPLWENVDKFTPHRISDEDLISLLAALERDGYKPSLDLLARAVNYAARANPIHPAREYFNSLEWDGIERLDTWLHDYAGCVFDDPRYVSSLGVITLVGAVSRIMNPGCKFDTVIVLEGPEAAMKSTMLEVLATFHGVSYFSDQVRINKIADFDTIPKMQGKVIIELPEMAGLSKQDMQTFKGWITNKTDEGRSPYGKFNYLYPRQFIIAGTINPKDGWLDDPTGGRRFLPVQVGRKIDIEALRIDVEQLWAEAVHRWRNGEKTYMTEELFLLASEARSGRRKTHPWQDIMQAELATVDSVTYEEIYRFLGLSKDKLDGKHKNTVMDALMNLGFENKPRYDPKTKQTKRKWIRA